MTTYYNPEGLKEALDSIVAGPFTAPVKALAMIYALHGRWPGSEDRQVHAWEAFPSTATIAREAGLSEASVKRIRGWLLKMDYLVERVPATTGRGYTRLCRLDFHKWERGPWPWNHRYIMPAKERTETMPEVGAWLGRHPRGFGGPDLSFSALVKVLGKWVTCPEAVLLRKEHLSLRAMPERPQETGGTQWMTDAWMPPDTPEDRALLRLAFHLRELAPGLRVLAPDLYRRAVDATKKSGQKPGRGERPVNVGIRILEDAVSQTERESAARQALEQARRSQETHDKEDLERRERERAARDLEVDAAMLRAQVPGFIPSTGVELEAWRKVCGITWRDLDEALPLTECPRSGKNRWKHWSRTTNSDPFPPEVVMAFGAWLNSHPPILDPLWRKAQKQEKARSKREATRKAHDEHLQKLTETRLAREARLARAGEPGFIPENGSELRAWSHAHGWKTRQVLAKSLGYTSTALLSGILPGPYDGYNDTRLPEAVAARVRALAARLARNGESSTDDET